MSVPSNIIWGSIVGSGNNQGRIGIVLSQKKESEKVTEYMDIYYQTRYAVTDSVNEFKYSFWSGHSASLGAKSIKHTSNSSWSDNNITFIGTVSADFLRTKSTQTGRFSASFSNIEYGGSSGSVSATFTVPTKENYTITFDANGGSDSPNNITKWYNEDATIPIYVMWRSGYEFLGWGTSKTTTTVTYQPGQSYTENKSITLYAIWKAISYTITFDANGGNNAPASMVIEANAEFDTTKIAKPTRTNYIFLGWARTSTTTEPEFKDGIIYVGSFYEDTTLYAVWKLDYINPKITNLSITRCDENMVADDYGTYAKIKFDWETYKNATAYALYSDGASIFRKTLTGKSGSVDELVKDSSNKAVVFSIDSEFSLQLNVADEGGHSTEYRMLNSAFIPIDFTENMKSVSFGEPCPEEDGLFNVALDKVNIAPKKRFLYNGENFFGQKLLWSGSSLMTDIHSITLSTPINQMKNGIVLTFGRDGAYNTISYFVPKESVVSFGRTGWCFPLCTALFDYIGSKTIYISNEKLEGHESNDATGKNATSGITYHNEAFYLKYVYEV